MRQWAPAGAAMSIGLWLGLLGCDALWQRYGYPNPRNCVANPSACTPDELCNPAREACEPLAGPPCSAVQPQCPAGRVCNLGLGQCFVGDADPGPTGVCLSSTVCWHSHSPLGLPLWGAYSPSADQVWFIGDLGTL
ncbi:MAG: hypothetical protein JNJ46_22260 [Myxococcales bacterium]|nr:hypothetical protein [Myxococcales bacterium]